TYTLHPLKKGYDFSPGFKKLTITEPGSYTIDMVASLYNYRVDGVPKGRLGNTNVIVSKFGFGGHIYPHNLGNVKEREYLLREAFDYGVTTFDADHDTFRNAHQFEKVGKYLAPVINDVVISCILSPFDGRTPEEQLEYDLRLFGKDHIDMVHYFANSLKTPGSGKNRRLWEDLFRFREQGKIRAVGVPIHDPNDIDLDLLLKEYPVDFVMFPYNFHHNSSFPLGKYQNGFDTYAQFLRKRGVGVVTMKPFATEYFCDTFLEAAKAINPDVRFHLAALRYVINSEMAPDITFSAMNYICEFRENVQAYLKPEMTDEERELLDKLRDVALKNAHVLPEHYRFLEKWIPRPDNEGIEYS
ncbi:hypothetical protein ACFL1R_12905, partial [Candidatus Latescibacterota bacterium]